MPKASHAFIFGLVVGIAGALISLFLFVQFNTVSSDDIRVIPKTAWFENYPVDCINDLCNVSWLRSYYNASILRQETRLGNLEGTDFQTTTKLIKYHFGNEDITVTDVRYVPVEGSLCEFGECWDDYAIEFQVSGDEGISILQEFGWRPSEKANALG